MNKKIKSLIACLAINTIVLCTLTQAESARQEFQRGKALFDKGQTKEAFKLLKSSASKGYGPAMNAVGFCYQYGKGVSKNYTNAAQYYRNAAVQGDANGAYNYGWMYLKGVGVDKNNDVAKKWLKIAANAGHADAKTILKQEGWLDEKPKSPKKQEPNKKSESPSKKSDTKTYDRTRQTTKRPSRSSTYSQSNSKWYVGKWDSTINNLIDHPKTVALRIEVVDKETREPIPNVSISFEGEYWIAPRTSFDTEGEREAQEIEYKVTCQTDSDGIAVGAFGWHKEYPWSHENDDVEKAQRIEFRHPRYKYVELRTPFYRFLEVGQKKTEPYSTDEDTRQQSHIFEKFEKTWALECAKRNVKFFVLDLGTNYKGFDNKKSTRPEFFDKIRDRKWNIVFEKPKNMMKWGMGDGRSWCGPYFVYLIEIQMERIRSRREYSDWNMFESINVNEETKMRYKSEAKPTTISTKTDSNHKETATTKTSYWQIGFLKDLNWGMEEKEVAKIMARNGYPLKVVSSYETTHRATVSGRPLYGKIRIDEIQLSFANRKLMSVSFVSANSSDAEALYAQAEKTFGVGLTTISHATEEQKKSIENPRLCKNSERYFTPTAIESRLGYTWSQRNRRFVQYCSINIYDWIKSDKVWDRDHSFEADRFQKLLKERANKKEISCSNCNGSGKCLSCNGKGQIYRDVYVKCGVPACGGRGRYRVRGGGVVTCRRCRGAGKFKTNKGENVPCSECNGSGKCLTCKGKGKVSVR